MIQVLPESPTTMLEQRLARGVELLFDMEQRDDVGAEYNRLLLRFLGLLEEYEGHAQS
jgi:hypothetical protein